jgi:hypothetical protein
MPLTLGIALALAASFNSPAMPAAQPLPQAQSVKQYVQTYFADEPIMISIAECESHFHQYDANGSVYRGVVNNLDVGVMQINEHYHSATAKKLGLDLYTIQGNVAYARYLYEKEGTTPWDSSSPCWGKDVAKTSQGAVVALANQ